MAKINLSKFKSDLRRAMYEEADRALKSLSKSELQEIGDAAVEEMKKAIAKGISPIATAGRFPAYKAAAAQKGKRGKKVKKQGYPFNQRKKFPDKRERPVNLFLSGDFLSDLKSFVSGKNLSVGFKEDTLSAKKEQGHREGVNSQPKRPIIPESNEEFSPTIYRRLLKTVQEVFRKKFNT